MNWYKTILIVLSVIILRMAILNFIIGVFYALINFINQIIVAIKYRKKEGFFKEYNKYNLNSAFNLDIYAQWNFRTLWNAVFSKGGFAFGTNEIETLSSVLGWKKLEKTLTIFALIWYYLLYGIDKNNWKNRGHCIASIDKELHKYNI